MSEKLLNKKLKDTTLGSQNTPYPGCVQDPGPMCLRSCTYAKDPGPGYVEDDKNVPCLLLISLTILASISIPEEDS